MDSKIVPETPAGKTVCLSHVADADGIVSAALAKEAFGSDAVLADYGNMVDTLDAVVSDHELKRLFICDLGLNHDSRDRFVEILSRARKNGVDITYVDHHDIEPETVEALEGIGVEVVNDPAECAAILFYIAYREKLSEHSMFLAVCAAIADCTDDAPVASRLLQRFDRQFVMTNAVVLVYNIKGYQRDRDVLMGIISDLSMSTYPHDMQDAFEHACMEAKRAELVMVKVRNNIVTMSNLGYANVDGSSASGAANFVLGLSEKDVGIAYRTNVYGQCTVSIRGSKNCKTNLGKLTDRMAKMAGGAGGGHARSCGAMVPSVNIMNFIAQFNANLDA